MTYRIYLRWPGQRVSDKTVTDDNMVADLAYCNLIANNVGKQAAAVKTKDGKNQQYIQLDKQYLTCERCGYEGPFIDEGECCPKCKLVQ